MVDVVSLGSRTDDGRAFAGPWMRGLAVLFVGFAVVIQLAAVFLSGGEDVAVFPNGLEICAQATDTATAEPCLDAIESRLDADTKALAVDGMATVDSYLKTVVPAVRAVFEPLGLESEWRLETDVGYPMDGFTATVPVRTRWRIIDAERVLWACLGNSPRVSEDSC